MARSRVSLIEITSSAFCALADSALETGADLSSLRHAHIGGDTVNIDRLRPLGRLYPRLALTNSYGPTECTDIATSARLAPGWSETARMPVSIGRPIWNARCYVLDERQQPVPAGIVGEIYIGGIGVGRGYLRRPDLTRERFLDDPHSPETGARMYRTGDLGRWRADGCLEFLDRVDRQVKVRGFRIELGDVEAELMRQPGIKFAAAVARGEDGGDKRLFAYVVPLDRGADLDTAALRRALTAKLPSYMVPGSITRLDAMPVTASGKLDRNALPDPQPDIAGFDASAPPRSRTEETLVHIWSDALGVPRIGVTDNPFDLGADSLLLLRVAARAGERLGREIAVADFFKYPTIRDLAAFLDSECAADRPEIAKAKSDAARRLGGRVARSRARA
jgi:acyl-coenzyme A synthetase/AMP-(fatty) acid ligase/acyl carrier protein